MTTSTSSYLGGYSNALSYTPIVPTGPTASFGVANPDLFDESSKKSKSSETSDGKGTYLEGMNKQRNELLVLYALPNELEDFLNKMDWAIEHAYDPITGLPNYMAYKALILGMNSLRNNFEDFKNAYDFAKLHGTLDEIAIGESGLVFVYDQKTQTAKTASISKVAANEHILTNGELAYLRKYSKGGIGNSILTQAITNSISIDDVVKSINLAILGLGSDKVSVDGQVQREKNNIKAGIEYLQSLQPGLAVLNARGISLDGVYKLNNMSESLVRLANLAMLWIVNYGLEPKMQMLLLAKAKASGLKVEDVIAPLINSKLKTDNSFNIESFTGSTANSTSGSKDTSMEMPEIQQWFLGYGHREQVLFLKGNIHGIALEANVMPITKNGNNIGMTTLNEVQTSGAGGAFMWSLVSMADQMVPTINLRQIAVDGDTLYKMELPIDKQALARNEIKPDLDLLDRVKEAEDLIKQRGVLNNPTEINRIYSEKLLPLKYIEGANTPVLSGEYRTFGVLNAYSHLNAFGNNQFAIDEDYLKRVDDKTIILDIDNIINHGLSDKSKTPIPSKGWLDRKSPVFETCVFIPIRPNWYNFNAGNKNNPTENQAYAQIEPRMLLNERLNSYQNLGEMPE